ncbi:MAG: transglutaminaseTgpA domain-containing protein [Acidimicrobiales bacterium]
MSTNPSSNLRRGAELGLIGVTAASVASFQRLFNDSGWLGPVLVMALSSHAVAIACRRWRLALPLAAGVSAVVFALVGAWVFYLHTTRFGLPTGDTLTALRIDLSESMRQFNRVVAPTRPLKGFVAATAVGFWLTSFLADWSAQRLWAPFEATLPAGGMFVFASLLGADQNRLLYTALFVGAVLAFLLLHRVAREAGSSGWIRGDSRRGARSLLRLGGALAVAAVAAAVVLGPAAPGAQGAALVDWKGRGGGSTVTVSPLVDIRARLVDQRDTEVFTVRSERPLLWRLTSLDDFDGQVWRSDAIFGQAKTGKALSSANPSGVERVEVTQEITMQALAQEWLPAAYEPRSYETGPAALWDKGSSTLILDNQKRTEAGLTYRVVSRTPRLDRAALEGAAASVPSSIRKGFLALPDDFSTRARDLARTITAPGATPYDKALLLQSWFLANYEYSTNVDPGHGEDRLEAFLFGDAKAGYCEQFAGAFAALARAVGLPSRVAVGFTPGDRDEADRNLYHVRGKHAHAWPEVYLGGYGWLPFDPTPGRGVPGGDGYTGVGAQQDSLTQVEGVNGTPETTLAPSEGGGGAGVEGLPEEGLGGELVDEFGGGGAAAAPVEGGGGSRWLLWTALGLLGAAAAYSAAMPALAWARTSARRRRAARPAERVSLAWTEAAESLQALRVSASAAETPLEFAARAGQLTGLDRAELTGFAELATAARYADAAIGEAEVGQALDASRRVRGAVRSRASLGARLARIYDPRLLLPMGVRERLSAKRPAGLALTRLS